MLEAPSTTLASRLSNTAAGRTPADAPARKDAAAPRRPRAKKTAAPQPEAPYLSPTRLPGAGGQRDFISRREPGGVRIRVNGSLPRSAAGRITAAVLFLGALAGLGGSLWGARAMLLRDPRLIIPSSDHIAITGNAHLTKPQLLSVFGEDVDQNVMNVPLADRQAELESLPWIEHATVMRLLPNRLQVKITERTPVAFIREGGKIGLVDGHGVLLDMTPGSQPNAHYSFPVVTGVHATDPADMREARMKLFVWFLESLDADSKGPTKVSNSLSEVDMSSPEDIRALLPSNGSDILVHFGDTDFLARYKRFEAHLPEWRSKFPRLASVDMRYERDVVLEMQPNTPVPDKTAPAADAPAAPAKPVAKTASPEKPEAKKLEAKKLLAKKPEAVKPAPARPAAPKPAPTAKAAAIPNHHSEIAFDVPAKSRAAAAKPAAKKPLPRPAPKPSAKPTPKGAHP